MDGQSEANLSGAIMHKAIAVAVLAAIGLLALIVVALSFVSPSLVHDILPAKAASAPK